MYIKREDALKELQLDHKDVIYIDKTECARRIKAIPSADRPSGEVDAVKEYEHQVHNLEQGYITLGEFDKRIEPLRHLHYDRPSGEWIDAGTDLDGTHYYRCSHCGWEVDTDYPNCPYCTAKMKGADDEDNH